MTVVVTGAAGGLGSAIAQRMSRSSDLLITDINERALNDLADTLGARGNGVSVRSLPGDITRPDFIADLAAATGPVLEALVHTAGVWNPAVDAARTFEINYMPTVLLLEEFLPLAGHGTVAICISSTGGHRRGYSAEADRLLSHNRGARAWPAVLATWGPGIDAHTAYGIAKRGMILECEARTRAWSNSEARIVSISPGNFATPMGALGSRLGKANFLAEAAISHRSGDPEEVADLVEFLCSSKASYISGCDIRIDGGAIGASRHSSDSEAFAAYDSQLVPRRTGT